MAVRYTLCARYTLFAHCIIDYMAKGCRICPPAYVAWRAGTTANLASDVCLTLVVKLANEKRPQNYQYKVVCVS
jgi:hypothetical protein